MVVDALLSMEANSWPVLTTVDDAWAWLEEDEDGRLRSEAKDELEMADVAPRKGTLKSDTAGSG